MVVKKASKFFFSLSPFILLEWAFIEFKKVSKVFFSLSEFPSTGEDGLESIVDFGGVTKLVLIGLDSLV